MHPREPKWPSLQQGIQTSMMMRSVLAAALLAAASLNAAEAWKIQYFYDKDDSSVSFTDIQCPSARRCVAAGVQEEGKHVKGVVLVTSDGGANWHVEYGNQHPISLLFLTGHQAITVTDLRFQQTEETGRS